MGLLDLFKSNHSLDLGEAVQKVELEKSTGKALDPQADAGQPNQLRRQLARQQEVLGEQLTQKEKVSNAEVADKEKQVKLQKLQADRQLNLQKINLKSEFARKTQGLLDNFQAQGLDLTIKENQARVEQVGVMLRLQNQEYIQQLKLEGQKLRLNNDLKFKEALQRDIFSAHTDQLEGDYRFKKLLDADDREFTIEASKISLEDAIAFAERELSAQATGQIFSGISNIVVGGLRQWDRSTNRQASSASEPNDSEG